MITNWKDVPVGPKGYPNYAKYPFKEWPPKGHECGWREAYDRHMKTLSCRNGQVSSTPVSTANDRFIEELLRLTTDPKIRELAIKMKPAQPTMLKYVLGIFDGSTSIEMTRNEFIDKMLLRLVREGVEVKFVEVIEEETIEENIA